MMNRFRNTGLSPWMALAGTLLAGPVLAQNIPTPESVLGFVPGTDRKLVEWPVLVDYYRQLAAASPRVRFHELGKTTNGAPFVSLTITSEANMAHLEEIRQTNLRLADPRRITSAAERDRLLATGKTIVLITSSIHSTEVGGHLSPTIVAWRLATDNSPDTRAILDNTVLLLVPSLNPDGVTIVADWYNRTLGTPAEGSGPPELYHHYVGHDNNRDWYAFTQVETQLTIDSLHNFWHPQIVHDIHQQGQSGSRFFLPPFLDPVEPNIDPLIVEGFNTLGTYMAWELTGQGKKGIVNMATYDAWTPARAYQHHHAGVRVLSETASARLATPIDMPFERLRPGRGFDAKVSSVNFAEPWPGGHWTLADIVDYQSSGALALLKHAAFNRSVWLANFLRIGERAIAGFDGKWPYAIVIPADQENEAGLSTVLSIMVRGDVEVQRAEAGFTADGVEYPAGTYVIGLHQPYGSFAKALLERQDYPDLRQYPGGPPRPPYDVTAHTLPLLMGIDVAFVDQPFDARLSAPIARPDPVYRYPGVSGGGGARVGLYQSYQASMDEGWTRWILEQWDIPFSSVHDADVRTGGLRNRYDVIVIPDQSANGIRHGLSASTYPEEYAGGIGDEGVSALRDFVERGGTLVTFNNASRFAVETFDLPVKNVVEGLDAQEFFAPGTLFELDLTPHALTEHMPPTSTAWFQRSPAWEVTDSSAPITVVGHYPDDPDRVLQSGWVLHPERIAGKAALLEARVGEGRVVLFGFRPQYRAQSIATFPLFFNALTGRPGT